MIEVRTCATNKHCLSWVMISETHPFKNLELFLCPPLDEVEKLSVEVKLSGVQHHTVDISPIVNSIRAV